MRSRSSMPRSDISEHYGRWVGRKALETSDTLAPRGVSPSFVAPRNEDERAVASAYGASLGIAEVGVEDDFFDLGGHSLLAIATAANLSTALGRSVRPADILEHPVVADLATFLADEGLTHAPQRPIAAVKNAAQVVLVHPVGGGTSCYEPLVRELGADYTVMSIDAPPLAEVGESAPSIEMLARHYVETLELSAGVVVGGWSFGGIVAFEIAHLLRGQGLDVARIVAIDIPAPVEVGVTRHIDKVSDAELLAALATHQVRRLDVRAPGDSMHDAALKVLEVGLAPSGSAASPFLPLVAGYRARLRSIQQYRPPEPVDVPIVVVRAVEPEDGLPGVFDGDVTDPAWGWGALTTAGVTTEWVKGGHNDVFAPDAIKLIANYIRRPAQSRERSA
jgi:thioesterase domain-containing protein